MTEARREGRFWKQLGPLTGMGHQVAFREARNAPPARRGTRCQVPVRRRGWLWNLPESPHFQRLVLERQRDTRGLGCPSAPGGGACEHGGRTPGGLSASAGPTHPGASPPRGCLRPPCLSFPIGAQEPELL